MTISNSEDYVQHHKIKRNPKLIDPSQPVIRTDLLNVAKTYLSSHGFQDIKWLQNEWDLAKRHEHRKQSEPKSPKKPPVKRNQESKPTAHRVLNRKESNVSAPKHPDPPTSPTHALSPALKLDLSPLSPSQFTLPTQ
jgi:hypothetical protein